MGYIHVSIISSYPDVFSFILGENCLLLFLVRYGLRIGWFVPGDHGVLFLYVFFFCSFVH